MRKPANVSQFLLLVGVLPSLLFIESQAFVHHVHSVRTRPFYTPSDFRRISRRSSPFGSVNHGGRGGNGGGKFFQRVSNDDYEDDNHQQQQQQRISWMLLGASVLSKTLEENQATACHAALSVSTIVPASSSKISWQRVLSVMFLVIQALRVNAVQVVSTGVKQSLSWYLLQLSNHPVVTKAITAGVVGFFGDYLAQWLEYSLGHHGQGKDSGKHNKFVQQRLLIHGTYEFRRGLGILVHGIIVTGPLMHWGYGLFEHFLPTTAAAGAGGGGRTLAAITHVVADSTVLDGIFIASTYFVTGILEGIQKDDLLYHFRRDYIPSVKASVAASITMAPLEFAYFRFLPVPLRPLFMNVNDIVWDAVISFMAHRSRHHHVDSDDDGDDAAASDERTRAAAVAGAESICH